MGRGEADTILFGDAPSPARIAEPEVRYQRMRIVGRVRILDRGLLRQYLRRRFNQIHTPNYPLPPSNSDCVLEALVLSNENPPMSQYGLRLYDSAAYFLNTNEVKLSVDLDVEDPQAIEEYARQRYAAAWGSSTWDPTLVEAILEAVVFSNQNPTPDEYGIALDDFECAPR